MVKLGRAARPARRPCPREPHAIAHRNPQRRLAARRPDRFLGTMLFWLKKFVSFWLMPFSFCVVAMAAGLWLMARGRWRRTGRVLAFGGLGLLLVLSNKFASRALIHPLETRYAPIPELVAGQPLPRELAECKFVYVLGGGNGYSPGFPAVSLLSGPALGRITEAVRLLRVLPDAKLIVSGPGDGVRETHASVLARAARSFGIAPERIIQVDQARDTEDESRAVKKIAGEARVAIVTSAWHMPRAMALCQSAGVAALAAPADFLSHADDPLSFDDFLWDPHTLEVSTLGLRERIGYLWIWLRGKAG